MNKIECGTKVTWNSSAGGYGKQKTGIVLAFIPREVNVFQVYHELKNIQRSRRKFDTPESLSSHRYLVEVQRLNQGNKVLQSHFYCPFAGIVERPNQQAIFPKIMDD